MAIMPVVGTGIDVIFDNVSIVRSHEDNNTRQMAVSPALVVVLNVFFDDVGVRN